MPQELSYQDKLKKIEELMVHPAVVELDRLSQEVHEWELKNIVLGEPTLAEVLKFRQEQSEFDFIDQFADSLGLSFERYFRLVSGEETTIALSEFASMSQAGIPISVLTKALQPKN